MSIYYEKVFWAEAHDDVQQLNLSRDWRRKRIVTLFLVSNKVLFHPSYLWRSSATHSIVFNKLNKLFIPDYSEIILGQAKSVEDYILTRVESLRRSSSESPVPEKQKYDASWSDINKNVPYLDEIFSDKNSQYGATVGNRDNLFRNALTHELRFGDVRYLRWKITSVVEKATSRPCPLSLFDTLIEWAQSSDFVSHEALVLEIAKITGLPLSYFDHVKLDALNIYLSSTMGSDVQVPFLLKSNQLFDPLDPDVFFFYLRVILGEKIYKTHIVDLDWNGLIKLVIALKEENLWLEARQLYLNALNEYSEKLSSDMIKIRLLQVAYKDYMPFLYANLNKSRIELLGVLFGVVGIDAITGLLQGIGMIGGLSVGLIDMINFYRAVTNDIKLSLRERLINSVEAKLMIL